MDRVMAVITAEKKYAERFCAYVNRRNLLSVMAVPFENTADCARYAKKADIELLVSDIGFAAHGGSCGISADDIKAKRRVYLSGNPNSLSGGLAPGGDLPPVAVREPDETFGGLSGPVGAPAKQEVFKKYQSAEKLIDEILSSLEPGAMLSSCCGRGKDTAVIGVFSPVEESAKTLFALTLYRELSRQGRGLYINLSEFSDINYVLGYEPSEGMAEAIYELKRGKLDRERIRSLTARNQGVEWLAPVREPEDYALITGEDYMQLINEIIKKEDCSFVVADMQRFSGQADELMDMCRQVYVPVPESLASSARLKNFRESLGKTREAGWLERLKYVSVPETAAGCGAGLDSLYYGKLGDTVRKVLSGGEGLFT